MSFLLNWSKFKRRLKFYNVGNKALLVLGILAIGAIGYLFLIFLPAAEVERTAQNLAELKDRDFFERVIAEGTLSESMQFIETFKSNPSDPTPVRIEVLRNKFDLAERIVSLSDNETASTFGKLKRLEARFELERIFNLNDRGTTVSNDQLLDQANKLADSEDRNTSRLAGLAQIYVLANKMDGGTGVEPPQTEANALRDSIRQISQKFQGDASVVFELVAFVNELRQMGKVHSADELITALADAYQGSQNAKIAEIVAAANSINLRKKYQLTGSERRVRELQQNVLSENSSKVANLIASISTDPTFSKPYIELVNCLMLITQAGFPNEAKKLAELSQHLFENDDVPEGKRRRFNEVRKVIGQIGSEFVIVQTVAQTINPKPTLVVLMSPNSVQNASLHIRQIGDLTRLMIEDGGLDVIAVYLDESETPDEKTWSDLREMMSKFPGVQLHKLNKSETEIFQTEYPISWLPTWLILDRDKILSQVSPPLPILEQMLLDHVAAESQ